MYLRKVNSLTLCSAGECTEGGGAVKCSRRSSTKRNPVHNDGSICTKSWFQHTDAEIILRHFGGPHYCWIMNTGWFIFMADACKNTNIARAEKYLRVLHGFAMEQVRIWQGEVGFSLLEEILAWGKIV